MMYRFLLALVISGMAMIRPAHADDFIKNNPDIKKYEFARSYITALGYSKEIDLRWRKKSIPKKISPQEKNKAILATINDLALDSSDLRVIKSYMVKYLTSPNMLIRKVADMVVVSTARQIAINDEQKILWQKWYELNVANQATKAKEISFLKSQHKLELQRKEADKDIIQATILMTKVLISDKNKDGKGRRLAITAEQRQKLLDKLDSFGKDTLAWGLKPGQRTLEGSVAVIREILEDSMWVSIDEK